MSNWTETAYLASPIWVQQSIVAVWGAWWHRRRFGSAFRNLVADLKAREYWTASQFERYRDDKLRILLAAARKSPYYRDILDDIAHPDNVSPMEVLQKFPILTKETLRRCANELLTERPVPKGTLVLRSSGTTGTPTEIYYTREFHAMELAISAARNLEWAGVPYNARRVMFGARKICRFNQSRPPFWRTSPVEDLAYMSIYHLSPKFLPHYVEFLRSYRPAIVMGYPHALATVANYALETGDMPAPARVVVTTSETLGTGSRKIIEEAWGCRVFDRYGAVEECVFASQCEYGRYHVSPDVGIVEIVTSTGEPAPKGVSGRIVCTGLHNTLQPLIRYEIGDVTSWSVEQGCPCGRNMPILDSIEGRHEDICYTPDGREMLRFDTVFKGVQNVRLAQVVQEALDLFTIYVVPASGFGEQDASRLRHNMRLHVGNVITQVRTVENIPKTASGKFRAVVSKVSRPATAVPVFTGSRRSALP